MTITLSVVIMLVAYTFGAITKIPNKYIPIQNIVIGIVSGIVCYFLKIDDSMLNSILLGIMSTMSAGGIADLIKIPKTDDDTLSEG